MFNSDYCLDCDQDIEYCLCTRNNPEPRIPQISQKLFMSAAEIFERLDAISELVATKNYIIPKAARERIGEELVKLGYELMESDG